MPKELGPKEKQMRALRELRVQAPAPAARKPASQHAATAAQPTSKKKPRKKSS